ncbi:MAG TPA: hypothetical protein DDX98_05865 [Bacteroidales bacterium]|nr:hypothetical protein [Bacteroidales bacterium]
MNVVFLSYINRSGSTFLLNQLSKVDELCVCPEADILFDLLLSNSEKRIDDSRKLFQVLTADFKWKLWRLKKKDIQFSAKSNLDLFLNILSAYRRKHFPKATTVIFKHPRLMEIFSLVPQNNRFKWIYLIRNPLAVYASQKETISPSTRRPMSRNPLSLIDEWNNTYIIFQQISGFSNTYIVNYETLIQSFDHEMELILDFISAGLSWKNCSSKKGFVAEWLSAEYHKIHPNINKAPQFVSIDEKIEKLSPAAKSIIKKYIIQNEWYVFNDTYFHPFLLRLMIIYFRLNRKAFLVRKKMTRVLKQND